MAVDPRPDPLAGALSAHRGDPFDGRAPYFREAQREKRRLLMQHLLSYGELLVVQGSPGSGRTRLLRQISDEAAPGWRVCLVEGDATMSHDRLESALIDGLGLDVDVTGESVVVALQRAIHDLRQGHVLPVCLVDDADELPASSLELIARLCRDGDAGEHSALGFLLVVDRPGPDGTPPAPLVALEGKVGHVFDWPELDRQGTRDYVFHCLRSAGEPVGAQFTVAALRLVHASSGGLPGRINPLARRLLHGGEKRRRDGGAADAAVTPLADGARVSGSAAGNGAGARGHRWGRRLGLLSLCLLLGLVWWQQDRINALFEGAPNETAVDLGAGGAFEETGAVDSGSGVGFSMTDGLETDADDVVTPEVGRTDLGRAGPLEATIDADAQGGGTTDGAEDVVDRTDGPTAPSPPGPTPEETAAAPDGAGLPDLPVRDRQAAAVSTVSRVVDDGSAVGGDGSRPAADASERDLGHRDAPAMGPDTAWLTSRPAGHFTLQLIALDPVDARRFVNEHGLGDEAVLLPRRGPGGRSMLAVIYGDFASRDAARRRAGELRRRIPGLAPWLRRFADIQAELARR